MNSIICNQTPYVALGLIIALILNHNLPVRQSDIATSLRNVIGCRLVQQAFCGNVWCSVSGYLCFTRQIVNLNTPLSKILLNRLYFSTTLLDTIGDMRGDKARTELGF